MSEMEILSIWKNVESDRKAALLIYMRTGTVFTEIQIEQI